MTKRHRADRAPAILDHFASGGGPLTARDIAREFGLTQDQASKLLSNLEHGQRYHAVIERVSSPNGCARVLRSLRRTMTPAELRRQAIAAALAADPSLANAWLAREHKCSSHTVSGIRRRLERDGSIPAQVARAAPRPPTQQPGDWITPTIRHPADEPHLAKAAQFRQIWPVGRQHAG